MSTNNNMKNMDPIIEMQKKLIEVLPDAIDALNKIIHDPNTKPKEIVSASNALSRAERSLERIKRGD